MAEIKVSIIHREKPSAVHLEKYGLTTLKNGVAIISIEKSDLAALRKQGKRNKKFTVDEIKTVEDIKQEAKKEKKDVKPKKGGW